MRPKWNTVSKPSWICNPYLNFAAQTQFITSHDIVPGLLHGGNTDSTVRWCGTIWSVRQLCKGLLGQWSIQDLIQPSLHWEFCLTKDLTCVIRSTARSQMLPSPTPSLIRKQDWDENNSTSRTCCKLKHFFNQSDFPQAQTDILF